MKSELNLRDAESSKAQGILKPAFGQKLRASTLKVSFDLTKTTVRTVDDDFSTSEIRCSQDSPFVKAILRPWKYLVFCDPPWPITKKIKLYFAVLKPKTQSSWFVCRVCVIAIMSLVFFSILHLFLRPIERTMMSETHNTAPMDYRRTFRGVINKYDNV